MERDPQNPQPPLPGGRARERLRQFEHERGMERTPVTLPDAEENAPPAGREPGEAGSEGGGTAGAPPGCDPEK
ncbi:MAG TPA: hypothetical protein VF006_01450 [Longimicrobium sp.]